MTDTVLSTGRRALPEREIGIGSIPTISVSQHMPVVTAGQRMFHASRSTKGICHAKCSYSCSVCKAVSIFFSKET